MQLPPLRPLPHQRRPQERQCRLPFRCRSQLPPAAAPAKGDRASRRSNLGILIFIQAYGLAIADADLALELDPAYTKAYYRRASGNFALGKYKLALKDFRHVCKLEPKDKQARLRLKECDRAHKAQAFANAIESEETAPFCECGRCGKVASR